ncbi:Hint domain-containing protein [Nioella sp.]|uniref:Hint domain-containing protein n=1 Tax=Nioella sp. TaxID=1912091 RepID=UPI003B51B0E5
MSDFSYVSFGVYFTNDGTFAFHQTAGGTITDADNDDQFEALDTSPQGTFEGTTTINGITAPVFQSGGTSFVYFPSDPGNLTGTNYQTNFTASSFAFCFLAGTSIATATCSVLIEDLVIGDEIMSVDGRAVKVKWIGYQTVSTRFGPAERLMPVRFAAGSLGDGLPTADLTVTADHGMFIDGVICHAGALVNGTTITQVPLEEMGETYTVYHIETEEHEIILANGAPAETFIDNVSRRAFDNFAEFDALYGDVPEMEELPYPRAMSARQVPGAIRRKLGASEAA